MLCAGKAFESTAQAAICVFKRATHERSRRNHRRRSYPFEAELGDETLNFSKTLGDFKPSMLQDLESRTPLEYEAFNGIVVKLLRQAGKDAPVNQGFYGALKYLDKKIRYEAAA